MPADADLPLGRRASFCQRPRITGGDAVEDALDRADMRLGMLGVIELHAVGRGEVLVQQDALHDLGEGLGAVRQAVEEIGVPAG